MLIKASPDVKFSVIHDMVSRDNNLLNITWMCEIAGVSRSGYYRWKEAKQDREERESKDRADFDLILWAYKFRGYDKGVRGINMRLLRHNPPIVMNPKKIRRLMRKFGLISRFVRLIHIVEWQRLLKNPIMLQTLYNDNLSNLAQGRCC